MFRGREFNKKTKCSYCKIVMDEEATYCAECNHYQARWLNAVKLVAGSVGLITLVASAITFSIGKAIEIYKELNPIERLTVLKVGSKDELFLVNSGKHTIYLEDAIFSGGPRRKHKSIAGAILPGELKVVSKKTQPSDVRYRSAETSSDGKILIASGRPSDCFNVLYFGVDHPAITSDPHKDKYLSHAPGKVVVSYFVVNGAESKRESIEVETVYRSFVQDSPRCRK
jgi:hypothetical protein